MVKYCMNLSDEKKETAIKIALESKGNVRKRKIAVPLLMILGIVIIFSSISGTSQRLKNSEESACENNFLLREDFKKFNRYQQQT